jgi:hypothetical protein
VVAESEAEAEEGRLPAVGSMELVAVGLAIDDPLKPIKKMVTKKRKKCHKQKIKKSKKWKNASP